MLMLAVDAALAEDHRQATKLFLKAHKDETVSKLVRAATRCHASQAQSSYARVTRLTDICTQHVNRVSLCVCMCVS